MIGPPCTTEFIESELHRMNYLKTTPKPIAIGDSVFAIGEHDDYWGKVAEISICNGSTTVVVNVGDGQRVTVPRRMVRLLT